MWCSHNDPERNRRDGAASRLDAGAGVHGTVHDRPGHPGGDHRSARGFHKSLHANLGSLEWTVNAYNLAFACLLLTGAALGDRFGRRRMFAIGVGAFTLASAISATSSSVEVLIAGRALQGAAAAVITPLTLTLISEAFPVEKRGAAIGMWGGIAGLAVAMGPVIGGAIVGGISWHWIFWLNIPIGVVLVPLALTRLSESFGPRPHLDIVGLVLVGAGAFGLTFGLIRANTVGWDGAEVVASVVAGVALLGAFVVWDQRAANPMLPLGFFRPRGERQGFGVMRSSTT